MAARILVASGDAFRAGLYARGFQAEGWSVEVAEEAGQALGMARDGAAAVIVDMESLGDPIALMRDLRLALPGLLIAAIVPRDDGQATKAAETAGADTCLLRGHFVPNEQIEKIARLLRGRDESSL